MRVAVVLILLLVTVGLPIASGSVVSGALGESLVNPAHESVTEDAETQLRPADPDTTMRRATAPTTATIQETVNDDPKIEFQIGLTADGDARWTITVRYELASEGSVEAFDSVGEMFESGETGPRITPFRNYAATATEVTNREMRIQAAERVARVTNTSDEDEGRSVGELRLSFTWTAFLESEGNTLVLGDVFLIGENGESWLDSLNDDQVLRIQTPDGYRVDSIPAYTPQIDENALVIEGPETFDSDSRIRVVYSPVTSQVPGSGVSLSDDWTLLFGLMIVGVVLLVGSLFYRNRTDEDTPPAGGATDGASSGPDDGPTDTPGSASSTATIANSEPETDETTETDLSLLSDEEQVEQLLERNGGRMRQADIVSDTGWSDAKVSQLLSKMADNERVEKLRLGRENLISLPGRSGINDDDPREL